MRRLAIVFGLSLACAGCTAHIILKNPRTDQVMTCHANTWEYVNPGRAAEECAQALERDGWVRLKGTE